MECFKLDIKLQKDRNYDKVYKESLEIKNFYQVREQRQYKILSLEARHSNLQELLYVNP